MAKARSMKRNDSMIKGAVRALQRKLSRSRRSDELVPEDVKEGHFAVLAVNDDEPKRFVVSLNCLSDPVFLRLLELAEEDFGFSQEGALAIPCKASELQSIIEGSQGFRGRVC
ncbi:uncharacterized protein A4U43_C07F18440 [Asparagus officinalis]|uniref:Uncharacterized protein n=1 Tax=Asparagus officinalis TaxID=4686 RepID=A0A5P1ED20_ASPOF|nr:auxin-responsive protein SAUR50-like [Asparagus officinalis]ONK63742.1 uncharacterized protein A4U43_C07F18440 [Asparagus officinalis]